MASDGNLYLAFSDSVVALNADGIVDWIYQTPDNSPVMQIHKTTDGTILLADYNRLFVIDPVTP